MLFILAIVLTSCVHNVPDGQGGIKGGKETILDCIEYKEGMAWNQISEKIGKDYIIKTGDDIWKNTVKYSDKTIILYTEKEGEGLDSKVVVKKIEICKEKEKEAPNVKP
jgi:hypothetical protein